MYFASLTKIIKDVRCSGAFQHNQMYLVNRSKVTTPKIEQNLSQCLKKEEETVARNWKKGK